MKRIAGGLALAAGLLAAAPAARAGEAGEAGKTSTEQRLEEVLAELESQRLEIRALKSQLGNASVPSLEATVNQYLAMQAGEEKKDPHEFTSKWSDGLKFETADKAFSLKVGGRMMYDFVFPDADDEVETKAGDFDALSGMRRLRIEFGGTIYENVYYYNSIDFADAGYAYKDNYLGIRKLPAVGNFQVGVFKSPAGLEELSTSKGLTFTERSTATNAFAPAHEHGVMLFNSYNDDQIGWWLADSWDGGTGVSRPQHAFTARVAGVPWRNKEDNALLHVGASMQMRSADSETDRFRARPETPFTPRTLDTGVISSDSQRIYGLELALQRGPLSFQAEYFHASVEGHEDVPGAPDPSFHGWYVYGSYFLTGESRSYKGGTFGKPKPKANYDGKGGTGAFEIGLRYARVDLDDDGVQGGVADDITLGLNWYLNPNARVMLDYVTHNVRWDSATDGKVNSVIMRFQVDF